MADEKGKGTATIEIEQAPRLSKADEEILDRIWDDIGRRNKDKRKHERDGTKPKPDTRLRKGVKGKTVDKSKLKLMTNKTGRSKSWMDPHKDDPKPQRPQAQEEEGERPASGRQGSAAVHERVTFNRDDGSSGTGTITSMGSQGAMVKEASGAIHKVPHGRYRKEGGGSDERPRSGTQNYEEDEDDRGAIDHVFGEPVSPAQLARMAGAPDDAHVRIFGQGEEVYVRVEGGESMPGLQMKRVFSRDHLGDIVCENELFQVGRNQGQGYGTQLLAQQVRECAAMGVSRIETHAAGSKGETWNGYYTWLRMGYERDDVHEYIEWVPEKLGGFGGENPHKWDNDDDDYDYDDLDPDLVEAMMKHGEKLRDSTNEWEAIGRVESYEDMYSDLGDYSRRELWDALVMFKEGRLKEPNAPDLAGLVDQFWDELWSVDSAYAADVMMANTQEMSEAFTRDGEPIFSPEELFAAIESKQEAEETRGTLSSISQLMETKEGRDWWREHGAGADMTFDLSEGSQSREVLERYMQEKEKQTGTKKIARTAETAAALEQIAEAHELFDTWDHALDSPSGRNDLALQINNDQSLKAWLGPLLESKGEGWMFNAYVTQGEDEDNLIDLFALKKGQQSLPLGRPKLVLRPSKSNPRVKRWQQSDVNKQTTMPLPSGEHPGSERLPGGRADGRPDSDFNAADLEEGTNHEMEHTTDRAAAREIAKDHLSEDADYYRLIASLEDKLHKGVRWPFMDGVRILTLFELDNATPLDGMRKATIKTPMKPEGGVDYDTVPVGATIWVTVTNEASPLHGRPIMITKRPDHQFALTGGSAHKYVKARKHLTYSTGKPKATDADREALKAREEARTANAPHKDALKKVRKQVRAEGRGSEAKMMEALGIKKKGLTKEERDRVQTAVTDLAVGAGFAEEDAKRMGRQMASGIAKKERERVKQVVAVRASKANAIWQHGHSDEDAGAMAGAEPTPTPFHMPQIDPEEWRNMSDPEKELAIAQDLDRQQSEHMREQAEASRFEDGEPEGGGPEDDYREPVADDPEETENGAGGPEWGGPETATDADLDGGDPTLPDAGEGEEPEGPAVVFEPEPEPMPVISKEAAEAAIEHFKEMSAARETEKEIKGQLVPEPDVRNASPAAVENLKLKAEGMSDEQVDQMMRDYVRSNGGPPETALYDAMMPHWNDSIGNKLVGAQVNGAASAITGLVGADIGARYDVQRLVDTLGPEVAAMAVVSRMRDEMSKEAFKGWVAKLREHNSTNQEATETKAMDRHAELEKQAEDLERAISQGDIQSKATVEMLRARNLMEQRENLGAALGSLQASAALYHFGEAVTAQNWRKKEPITINVGESKLALDDKLKRLGNFRHKVTYTPANGWQIHTDTQAIKKYATKTEADNAHNSRMREVKYDTSNIRQDSEGREWAEGYTIPGFRTHFSSADALPEEHKHLAGQPLSVMADQRNNIEWIHQSGGGLVTMRTGGGKTAVSMGVASKMLHENPHGMHMRVVPDGRQDQWAQEIGIFTHHKPVIMPAKSTKEERARILAAAPPGSIVIVGHTHAGRDHENLSGVHAWDSIGIDEPQELTSRTGSGKLSAGAKRIYKIPAKNRHALTATPATENPAEAYDIVNWTNPGQLGYRTRFERAFAGFGGGTNAQDAALQKMLYNEIEPHVSGERMVPTHYNITRNDVRVSTSDSQRAAQTEIEARVDAAVEAEVALRQQKKRDGVRGYANKSWQRIRQEATEKAMSRVEAEHRANMGGGDLAHNPKMQALHDQIATADPEQRHVIFVDSPDQRRAVQGMLDGRGVAKAKIKNITKDAKGAVRKTESGPMSAIEVRKREWKRDTGGFIIIDPTSAAGHNLAEGDHLHMLGSPDDAAQMLQAHGRLGRSNRQGDFAIHTYRFDDSPFEHATWNKLDRQTKILEATAPGMFVKGRSEAAAEQQPEQPARRMTKSTRLVLRMGRRN